MGRMADCTEDAFLKTDTAATILPFPPKQVPGMPPLLYIDVEPRAHREWMERKRLRWGPMGDRYYCQLRFDKENAKPSILLRPTATQPDVETDEDMKVSIGAIVRKARVEFRNTSTQSGTDRAADTRAVDQEEASSTGDAFSAYGLAVDSILDTSSVKRNHECIACIIEGRRIPVDWAFQTCQSYQRAAVVDRGNSSGELDPRMKGRAVPFDSTTDY